MFTGFSILQNTLFYSALALVLISLVLFVRKKVWWSVGVLFLAALLLNAFAALLDPFLNIWDERFHALVAKNMMEEPFRPMLYKDPIMLFAYDNWDRFHIWLHKQPLFLWQIALSFKLFGVSEFSLRIPNLLMASLLVPVSYRTGKLLVSERTGYLAALLMMSSWIMLELVSGRQEMEHNDLSFLFYVSCSIWAWLEWREKSSWKWVLLIGMFSGAAVLCKWLPGLLVFGAWSLMILLEIRSHPASLLAHLPSFFLSFLTTCILFLPWQFYIFSEFPDEAKKSYEFNVQHFTFPVDGHAGPWYYHFDMLSYLYGTIIQWLLLPALIVLYLKAKNKTNAIAFVAMIVTVFAFFSVSQTKAPCYTMMVSMIVFISMGSMMDFLMGYLDKLAIGSWQLAVTGIVMVMFNLRMNQMNTDHSLAVPDNRHSRMMYHNREIFKSLELPENAVLLNVLGRHFIEAMYYTGVPAYPGIPDSLQYQDLLYKKRLPVILLHPDSSEHDLRQKFPRAVILKREVQGYY